MKERGKDRRVADAVYYKDTKLVWIGYRDFNTEKLAGRSPIYGIDNRRKERRDLH
ncbi:hypothetical protein LCGC14_2600030 [marine sediment metagenome]|uniref:Uncharacterized protein n=1 Tax=marine sediment metagenome TaxID=412755 RepID=A0A0F9A8Z9_9ZZZZ